MKFDDFDRQMRVYEESLDQFIPPEMYIAARLDGRSFTRLTKELCGFEAPFDVRFRWIELLKRNGNHQAFNKVKISFSLNTELA